MDQQRLAVHPGEILFGCKRQAGGDGPVEPVSIFAMVGISVVRQNQRLASWECRRRFLGWPRTGSGQRVRSHANNQERLLILHMEH